MPLRKPTTLLLLTGLAWGCQGRAGSPVSSSQQGVTCNLNNESIALQGSKLPLPSDHALTSVSSLVTSLSAQSEKEALLIHSSEETTANTLLRVLLSAQEAELSEAYLAVAGKWLEIALPDSSTIPPLSVADVFFSLNSGKVTASRDVSVLGSPTPHQTSTENRKAEIRRLIKQNCRQDKPCTHAVLSLNSSISFKEMTPLMTTLSEFRGGAGTLRLVISGDAPPGSAATSQTDPRLTRALIQETIAASNEKLHSCRGKSVESTETGGTVTVEFTVTGLGLVFDATVVPGESTIEHPLVRNCIREAFLQMKFAKPEASSLTLKHVVRL